jgi:hypothetical protein
MPIQQERSFGRVEFHVEDISTWNGFEEICRFFVEHLGATHVSQNDGPDARVWKVQLKGEIINVVHDDMVGNFFFAERNEAEAIASQIAEKLNERIQSVNP